VRIGRCGALARTLARALRALAPVRGIGPFASMVLGAPRRAGPCPARRRIGGVELELDLRESLHRAVYLDLFSRELRRVVLALLRDGDLFVDAGANFGFWTLLAAQAGCRVVAIEPVPPTRELLAANAERNGLLASVEIVAAALSDAPGTLTLALPDGESGQASVRPDRRATLTTFSVPATTLDELIGERAVRFLKIDVEGHERALLAGARRLLGSGQVEYVLIELSSGVLERSGGSAAELIDLLSGAGYEFVRFVRANEGFWPRRSYGRLDLAALRAGGHAGDALWVRRSEDGVSFPLGEEI
jgi:FkbM family methyltransferase